MTTEIPTSFGHPYQPYSIQVEFMQAVYDAMTQGKIGIFESPTGTVCTLFDIHFNCT